MSAALQVMDPQSAMTVKQAQPFALDDLERMAKYMASSRLFGVQDANQAVALMLIAQAEGEHPATIAQDYDIIQGRAARKTHSVLARFQRAGGKVEWHTLTDDKAEATFSHPSGGSVRIDWTIERARTAGLAGKDNWKKFARAMLRARCIGEGVRAVYPAALGGMRLDMEMFDFDMQPVPQLDDEIAVKQEIQMPKPKAAVAPEVVDAPAKSSATPEKYADVTDVEPVQVNETPAEAPRPVETQAVTGELASAGAKKFLEKKLAGKDAVAFAKEHGVDWDNLTIAGFNTLKGVL